MTVSNETYRHDYNGNDVTVDFPISFYFLVKAHIEAILYNSVTEIETSLILPTHYDLADAGNPAGGTLTMVTAPTSDETLTIIRNVDYKQETDLVENATYSAEVLERVFDKLTMLAQQMQEQMNRTIRQSKSHPGNLELPAPIEGNFLNWVSGKLENYNIADLSLYSVSVFMATLLDDVSASAFLATLGVLAPYESTMTGNETFTPTGIAEEKFFLDPNGAQRTFNPSGSFSKGYTAIVINVGGSYNIVFDSAASAQVLTPGSRGVFIYDGTIWR